MALEEKTACLWHAFNALDDQHTGSCIKSKLKVLTHNIGNSVGIDNVQVGLDAYREKGTITFPDYLNYLKIELFSRLSSDKESNSNVDLSKVDEVCWMLCSAKYLQREKKLLGIDDAYKLWRMFNLLVETDDKGNEVEPLVLHAEEAGLLIEKLQVFMGQQFNEKAFADALMGLEHLSYQQFLYILENKFLTNLDSEIISTAVTELYEEYVVEVIKKGYLHKKAPKLTAWKERWFVLSPGRLKYYASRAQGELRGEIAIVSTCKVQNAGEKSVMNSRAHRFQLVTDGRPYELAAPDARTRTEWMAVLRSAIDQCLRPYSPQKVSLLKRRTTRQEKAAARRQEEEARRQAQEAMEVTRQELMAEKQARAQLQLDMIEEVARRDQELERLQEIETERAALQLRLSMEKSLRGADRQKLEALEEERHDLEQQLLLEATIREAEQRRLRELQAMKGELQQLLEEERQAKRDEEIVRGLQARMLTEEIERREELEALQAEMAALLDEERQRREGLESQQAEAQRRVQDEARRLEGLARDRKSLDGRLQEALTKLHDAEAAHREMKQKLDVKEKDMRRRSRLSPGKVITPEAFLGPDEGPVVSHRGRGAFTEGSFAAMNRSRSVDNGVLRRSTEQLDMVGKEGEDEFVPH